MGRVVFDESLWEMGYYVRLFIRDMNLPKPLSSLYYFIRVLSTYLSIDSSALICENTKIMISSLIIFLHDYSQKIFMKGFSMLEY